MSHEEAAETCRNCGAALTGPYCAACGQKTEHLHRPFWEIAEDFLHTVIHFDGRLWRTLRSLFLRPGEMTADWADGRQARYMPPIRLFIFTSLILVSVLSLSDVVLMRLVSREGQPAVVATAPGQMTMPGLRIEFLGLASENTASPAIDESLTQDASSDAKEQRFASRFVTSVNTLARDPHVSNLMIGKSLSRFMLLAVPVMSALLWLLYLRQKRYLAEHVVFALNIHTFFFIGLLIAVVLQWITRGLLPGKWVLLALWTGYSLHFLLALKRMYQQSWTTTILKSALITGTYMIALMGAGLYLMIVAMIS